MNFFIEDHTRKPPGWAQLDTVRLVLSSIVVISHANYVFITPLGHVALFPFIQCCAKSADNEHFGKPTSAQVTSAT